jgi:hypothetical protein
MRWLVPMEIQNEAEKKTREISLLSEIQVVASTGNSITSYPVESNIIHIIEDNWSKALV